MNDSTNNAAQVANQPATLAIAEGSIDPQARLQQGIIISPTLDELVARIPAGDFYDDIGVQSLPCACVDGRARADGRQQLSANASGGTFSLVMADALTTNSYRQPGQKADGHAKRLYGELVKLGKPIGGHDDDRATLPSCGCGAEDKLDSADASLPSILGYIERRGSDIRTVLRNLSVDVSDETHQKITAAAASLRNEEYATNGQTLRQAFVDAAGEAAIETLTGAHNEVAVVINSQAGKTLNRQKVAAAYGNDYQVFNLDVWALKNGCDLISLSADEAHEKLLAALYYNVAVAAVLAGPSLRVVAR